MRGKIVKGIAGFYYVFAEDGKIYECKARGIFRNKGIKPLVGDDVSLTPDGLNSEGEPLGIIADIRPRVNSLIRPAVANIDQVVLYFAIADPMPNLNLLDRFLIYLQRCGIPAVICFNKNDLSDGRDIVKIYEDCGYRVVSISVKEKSGLSGLREVCLGKTTVLAGPSGVGKSSFINYISPDAGMETGEISRKIKRGKHTTRHSEMFCFAENSYIMDTPGFTSLYPGDMDKNELKDYFPEFEAYETECRFQGCVHIGERDCGVKRALSEGRIAASRYENYKLIFEELAEKKKWN